MHKLAERIVTTIVWYIYLLEVERALLLCSETNVNEPGGQTQEVCNLLSELLHLYQQIRDHYYAKMNNLNTVNENSNFACAQEAPDGRGRPKFQIDKNHVNSLRQLGSTWTKISSILGISRSTLNRRRTALGLESQSNYSEIPDDELDVFITTILTLSPNSGELMVRGALRGRGIRVQRRRLRESIWRVDPTGREMRRRFAIQRRIYNITVPNRLW